MTTPHLRCPVCLAVPLHDVTIEEGDGGGQVSLDACRRCGGVWLAQESIEMLRKRPAEHVRAHPGLTPRVRVAQCHHCHAPISRDAAACESCGWTNRIACPRCERPMQITTHDGLRLDVCTPCRGAWFDRNELEALWSPRFDLALARRNLVRRDRPMPAESLGDELLFQAVFFGPDVVALGGSAVAHVANAAADGAAHVPDMIGAVPDVAAGTFDAVGEASTSVFEAVAEIVAGLFS